MREAQTVLSPVVQEKKQTYSYDNYRKFDDDEILPSTNVGGYSSNYAKSVLMGAKPKENATYKSGQYKSGTKVRHTKFGEGTVIMVKGEGENVIVDVAFKGVGIKSLSAKFAPMEIING